MKDQDIESLFKDVKAPAPDPEARLRAKQAALAEFARSRSSNNLLSFPSQDSGDGARLSREHNSREGASMKRFANRGWYAAAAGIGVLGIGLTWVLPNLSRYTEELDKPVPAAATDAPAPGRNEGEFTSALPASEQAAARSGNASGPAARVDARTGNSQAAMPPLPEITPPEEPKTITISPADTYADSPAPPPAPTLAKSKEDESREVLVTGMRANRTAALESKRAPVGAVDAITAEDIGQLPDSSVAESQQRIVGFAKAAGKAEGGAYHDEGRDKFQHFEINPVRRVADEPVSTFSADVDTASYSFVRARINEGGLPQKDAVRAEEMVNYFDYSWPAADSRSVPFKPTVVVSDSPWGKGKKLVHIGIKGYEVDRDATPPANLVLLLDVSGSMNEPNKLPLVVRSMELLLQSLKPTDTVGIVVYAGAAGTVLEPTPAREKDKIIAALRSLRPGGSTAGAEGIERAYQLAEGNFRKGGVNRILLCTDGDFNVGIDGTEELKGFVERKREKGVYLSVLGFGEGNYRDELAQALAQNGNGVAAYIDTENEARKVLVQEASASLFTIAKDVKLQVEFNPVTVGEYRLVGYETRALKREDFNNDAVDAGDVGAGHTVTAIYEITPVGAKGSVDEPYFEGNRKPAEARPGERGNGRSDLYGFLKIRYKLPGEKESKLISEPLPLKTAGAPAAVKRDVEFSTAVAGFAQLLRGGAHTGSLTYDDVIEEAQAARGEDRFGYRAEFIELVRRARQAAKN
jgi:Ca-activated chloride channel family protein